MNYIEDQITKTETKKCIYCEEIFKRTQSPQRFKEQKYCSRKCMGADKKIGTDSSKFKKTCMYCGKEFRRPTYNNRGIESLIPPSLWKVRKYCSLSCSSKATAKERSEKRKQDSMSIHTNIPIFRDEKSYSSNCTVRQMTDFEKRMYGVKNAN